MRILLVDDFEMVRMMLKTALNDLGFHKIEEADNGVNGFEKLKAAQAQGKPFDIIFCDWGMPEMSGIELLEACRKTIEFKQVPFIMVTAEAEREYVVRALKAGANEYITKPIAPDVLQKKIAKIVSRAKEKAS